MPDLVHRRPRAGALLCAILLASACNGSGVSEDPNTTAAASIESDGPAPSVMASVAATNGLTPGPVPSSSAYGPPTAAPIAQLCSVDTPPSNDLLSLGSLPKDFSWHIGGCEGPHLVDTGSVCRYLDSRGEYIAGSPPTVLEPSFAAIVSDIHPRIWWAMVVWYPQSDGTTLGFIGEWWYRDSDGYQAPGGLLAPSWRSGNWMELTGSYADGSHTSPYTSQLGIGGQSAIEVWYLYYWLPNPLNDRGYGYDPIDLEPSTGLSGQCS